MEHILNFDSNIIENIIYPIIVEYYQNSEITTKKIYTNIDSNNIWKNGPKFVIKQNIEFIKKNMKFLQVNRLWNKIVLQKIKKICMYVADEKVSYKIPYYRDLDYRSFEYRNHRSCRSLDNYPKMLADIGWIIKNILKPNFIDKFIENNNNPNNLILDIDSFDIPSFHIQTMCQVMEKRLYAKINYREFMEKNDILCIGCNKSNCVNWANIIRKYIVYGFPKILRDRIINIWKVQQSCYKCKCIEVCLEHPIDRDLLSIYTLWGTIEYGQCNKDGMQWHKKKLWHKKKIMA
jgi:hypothetical protein